MKIFAHPGQFFFYSKSGNLEVRQKVSVAKKRCKTSKFYKQKKRFIHDKYF